MDLASLANGTNAATALASLILVSPQKTVGYQPQLTPSFLKSTAAPEPAFLFHYEGEQAVLLESDITDHFVENNTAVNDQIALRPETITVQGFIGELNNVAPKFLEPAKFLAEKLTTISPYTPSLSQTALLAYNEALFLYSVGKTVANTAVSAWSSINGNGGESVINGGGISVESNQNQQQIYFQRFYGYWASRTLFTIQTPWAIFQDMAIKSLRAIQDADTRMITAFEITFKIMRFASTQVSQSELYDNNQFQGRAFFQGANEVDLGVSTPRPALISLNQGVAGIA